MRYHTVVVRVATWALITTFQILNAFIHKFLEKYMMSLIATFMGPTWGPPGSCRPQMGPILPHEPCYQGYWVNDIMRCQWLGDHFIRLSIRGKYSQSLGLTFHTENWGFMMPTLLSLTTTKVFFMTTSNATMSLSHVEFTHVFLCFVFIVSLLWICVFHLSILFRVIWLISLAQGNDYPGAMEVNWLVQTTNTTEYKLCINRKMLSCQNRNSYYKDTMVSHDHLIFIMGIPLLVTQCLYIESAHIFQWAKMQWYYQLYKATGGCQAWFIASGTEDFPETGRYLWHE